MATRRWAASAAAASSAAVLAEARESPAIESASPAADRGPAGPGEGGGPPAPGAAGPPGVTGAAASAPAKRFWPKAGHPSSRASVLENSKAMVLRS